MGVLCKSCSEHGPSSRFCIYCGSDAVAREFRLYEHDEMISFVMEALTAYGGSPYLEGEESDPKVFFTNPSPLPETFSPNSVVGLDALGSIQFGFPFPLVFKESDATRNGLAALIGELNKSLSPWSGFLSIHEDDCFLIIHLNWHRLFGPTQVERDELISELKRLPEVLAVFADELDGRFGFQRREIEEFLQPLGDLAPSRGYLKCLNCMKFWCEGSYCGDCGAATTLVSIDSQNELPRFWEMFEGEIDSPPLSSRKGNAFELEGQYSGMSQRYQDIIGLTWLPLDPKGPENGGVHMSMSTGQHIETIWVEAHRNLVTVTFWASFYRHPWPEGELFAKDTISFLWSFSSSQFFSTLRVGPVDGPLLLLQGFSSFRLKAMEDEEFFTEMLKCVAESISLTHKIAGSIGGGLMIREPIGDDAKNQTRKSSKRQFFRRK
jgi:hypothetical protein